MDAFSQGLAGFVGGASKGFNERFDDNRNRSRQDELMNKQRQFQMEDRGTARHQKLEDEALQTWLGIAKEAGYLQAKTPEDKQKIANMVDQSFVQVPIYGKLLPMVKARMDQEAGKPQQSDETNFGRVASGFGQHLASGPTADPALMGIRGMGQVAKWGLSKPGTFTPSLGKVIGMPQQQEQEDDMLLPPNVQKRPKINFGR